MANQIEALNAQFALADQLRFQTGENGLPRVQITNRLATAEVYLHGGHITAFQPQGSEPVLWMSPLAQFQHDKAIRGGVPIIWPWFGPHAIDKHKPQHGFARTMEWRVSATKALPDGSTQLQLQLNDTPVTHALWPHAFELSLSITVGTELNIELTSRNTGEKTFTAGGALHSYFAVGDVRKIHIDGLLGRHYIDQLDGNRIKQQSDAVYIREEVDRIYFDTEDTCTEGICAIFDAQLLRQIYIKRNGSHSTVVWNPWKDKARAMTDFPDDGYQQMVCIETANAVDDVRHLAPGETHTLSQIIGL
ncbi:MAG: D-hexose-6-phosphate mutarotase [Gammaproteobacteria bacterium]|nr:D-hexose-6-phosphate mutarotase [Gammaproteobacteria bacterium]MCF6259548.1 D-hexose-6-phosphate mutarotase [Gammaproteobacteria bacterium]